MKPTLLFSTLLLGALAGPAAHAGILFQQTPSVSGNSFDITDFRLADDFVLAADSTIAGIGFWYQAQFPSDLSQVTYAIYADQSGGLGTLLQSETFSPALSVDGAGLLFADFGISPLALSANTPYWLELHAGAGLTDASGFTVSWAAADDNASAGAFKDDSLGLPATPVGFAGFSQYAFQIEGDPTVTSTNTPEPGTVALFSTGLLLMVVTQRFRARKLVALPACLLLSSLILPAQPHLTAYISSSGSDAAWFNGCTMQHPCRSWEGALFSAKNVQTGIPVPLLVQTLNPGDFGQFPADFGELGPLLHLSPMPGSVIDGGGTAYVTLNDIYYQTTSDPLPSPISWNVPPLGDAAAMVLARDVTIRNLTISLDGDINSQHVGVWVKSGNVRLENVTIVGPGMLVGVLVTGGGTVSLNHVTIKGTNGTAVYIRGGSAYLRDSTLEGQGSGTTGVFVSALAGSGGSPATPGAVNLDHSQLTQFGNALGVDGSLGAASARLSDSLITGNILSMAATGGGSITSLRNNVIDGNVTNATPQLSISLK